MPSDLPRRVLLVLHEERLGGASRAALRALEPLVDRGLELRVWCPRPSELHDELTAAGIAADGAPRPFRYSLARLREPPGLRARVAAAPRYARALRRHLRAVDPDLVHVNAAQSMPEAVIVRSARYPLLLHVHEAAWPGVKGAALRRGAWAVADEVAAISRANARPLAARGREPRILPSPVRMPEAPHSRIRAAGAPLVVASVGALSPRKGTDLFVDAAELLAGSEPRMAFVLAGGSEDAPSADWAATEIARARAAGVDYRPRVDVESELPGWDIVVVPSRDEPFGLVLVEAMAAGRAVVAARSGGPDEILEDGGGVLIPGDDARALANAIAELARRPELRAELGAAGHARAARYDARHAADRLAAAYAEVLRRSRGTVAN